MPCRKELELDAQIALIAIHNRRTEPGPQMMKEFILKQFAPKGHGFTNRVRLFGKIIQQFKDLKSF